MGFEKLILLHLLLLWQASSKTKASYGILESIRSKIIEGYDPMVRPPTEVGKPVNVSVALVPQYVEGVRESEGKFTVLCGVDLTWVDGRLQWDPQEYNSTPCIFLQIQELWSPEVRFTFAMKDETDLNPRSLVRVCSEGLVHLTDFRRVTRFAKFDTNRFPLDSQRLVVGFSQTTAGIQEIDMHLIDQDYEAMRNRTVLPADWVLKKIDCKRYVLPSVNEIHPQSYAAIYCFLSIKRDPSYISLNFCVPAFVVTLLAVLAIHSSETATGPRTAKYELGLVSLMSVSVLTLSLADSLPHSGVVSRLHIFYYGMIASIFSSCFVSWLAVVGEKWLKATANQKKKRYLQLVEGTSVVLHVAVLFCLMAWFFYEE